MSVQAVAEAAQAAECPICLQRLAPAASCLHLAECGHIWHACCLLTALQGEQHALNLHCMCRQIRCALAAAHAISIIKPN